MSEPRVPGNLPLGIRNRVKNADGTTSTVRTISVGVDGGEVLIPTVIGSRVVSDDEAMAHYRKTGENFGTFDTPDQATAYAENLHRSHEAQMSQPNPYAQFVSQDDEPAEGTTPIPEAPATIAPGENPAEAGYPDQPTDNIYSDPANMAPTNAPMSDEDFSSGIYDRLRANEPVENIEAWLQSKGRSIKDGEARRGWLDTVAIRDRAAREGNLDTVQFGRVVNDDANAVVPGENLAKFGAFGRKAADIVAFNGANEIYSGMNAGLQALGGRDFSEAYDENWLRGNAGEQMDQALHPGAVTAGTIAGIGASMAVPGAVFDKAARFLAPRAAQAAGNMAVRAGTTAETAAKAYTAGNVAARSVVGATTGATSGAVASVGAGAPGERFDKVVDDGLIGLGIGAAFPLVAQAFGTLGRAGIERFFPNSGRALGSRAKLTEDELQGMERELLRQRDLGLNPTFFDVAPERIRNLTGSAGRHDSARTQLQEEAASRANQLPERVQRQGDEVLLPTAPDLDPALARNPGNMREALDEYRVEDMDAAMEPIRRNIVPLEDDVIGILGSGQGQRAIQDASEMEVDPELRQQLLGLGQVVKQLQSIDPRMPPQVREQITREMLRDAPFTINASEKISRALFNSAKTQGADSPALKAFGSRIRDAARQDPDFEAAMARASAQHTSRDAVTTGEGLLTQNADDFTRATENLGTTPTSRVLLDEDAAAAQRQYSPEEENHALDEWQGQAAGRITKAMEHGDTLQPEDAQTLAVITRLINSNKVEPQILYRGIGVNPRRFTESSPTNGYRYDQEAAQQSVIDILNRGNKGPKSHATDEYVARDFADPDGATYEAAYSGRGLDLAERRSPHTGDMRDGEAEVILPPGKFVQQSNRPLTKEDMAAARITARNSQPDTPYHVPPHLEGRYVADPIQPDSIAAPSDLDLARIGGASAARTQAGKGPSEARNVASQFYDSPEQGRRTERLVGQAGRANLADRMRGEVERVYRAGKQATREGPKRESTSDALTGFANAMYNPTSAIPWTREVARFVQRIGMTERDAQWIVKNVMDESKAEPLIALMRKHGMNREQADIWADSLRDGIVKASVANEGGRRYDTEPTE